MSFENIDYFINENTPVEPTIPPPAPLELSGRMGSLITTPLTSTPLTTGLPTFSPSISPASDGLDAIDPSTDMANIDDFPNAIPKKRTDSLDLVGASINLAISNNSLKGVPSKRVSYGLDLAGPSNPIRRNPSTSYMVQDAIRNAGVDGPGRGRGGVSLQSIKKHLTSHFSVDVSKRNHLIKQYLVNGVARGDLVQLSGQGANGSFKMAVKKPAAKRTKNNMVAKRKITKKTVVAKKKITKKKTPARKAVPDKRSRKEVAKKQQAFVMRLQSKR